MNKTIKYTTGIGSAMFALAFAVTAASAQTTDVVNTGDDVDVEAGSSYELNVDVQNSNEAYVSQSSYNFLNTGNNDSDGNIGGGSIDTGNAVAMNEYSVQANSNTTTVSDLGFSNGSNVDASIVNTGDDLDAELGSEYDVEVDVENDNEARIEQFSFNYANTGDNETDDNIDGGDIDTGNAGFSNEFEVLANHNDTEISGLGSLGGNNSVLDLVNTGDDVDVELGSEYDVEVDVENDNEVYVGQFAFNFLNTGDNETDDNIGGGDIDTGDVLGENLFSVMANSNMTEIGLEGMFDGDETETTVTNTGDDLEVESGLEVDVEVDVESDNASVNIQTTVNGLSTGGNDNDDNIDGGDTDSGNAGVWTEFLAELNGNWTVIE